MEFLSLGLWNPGVQDLNMVVSVVKNTLGATVDLSTAYFCHACKTSVTTTLPGDTCWALAIDQKRGCGCNSGGWDGIGFYYGGYTAGCTVCTCQGGAFSGYRGASRPKGGIASIGVTLDVTPGPLSAACTSYSTFCTLCTSNGCINTGFLANFGFERDAISNYFYMTPTSWTSGSSIVITQGNGPWGGSSSGYGSYYLGIQSTNSYILQTVTLPTSSDSQILTVSFVAANRPNIGLGSFSVKVTSARRGSRSQCCHALCLARLHCRGRICDNHQCLQALYLYIDCRRESFRISNGCSIDYERVPWWGQHCLSG